MGLKKNPNYYNSSSSENSYTSNTDSDFDEEYYRLKPPPIKIDPSRVVQVYAELEQKPSETDSNSETTNSNTSQPTILSRRQRKNKNKKLRKLLGKNKTAISEKQTEINLSDNNKDNSVLDDDSNLLEILEIIKKQSLMDIHQEELWFNVPITRRRNKKASSH